MHAVHNKNRRVFAQTGFSLIELLISVLVFGFGILVLSTTLFPLFSKSATPHFEARASALGQTIMSQVMARKFDRSSDANGSRWRCGESALAVSKRGIASPKTIPTCAPKIVGQKGFVAVDDYIGCWATSAQVCTKLGASGVYKGTIAALFGGTVAKADYKDFSVNINVVYDDKTFLDSPPVPANPLLHKRIDIQVVAGKYGQYDFSSYRSNF